MNIIVGSRGSKLAITQTNWVIEQLKLTNPEVEFEVKVIKTKGDRIQNVALDKIGDKGLFVKEIEDELLNGTIHMAIHSMKDMPGDLPEGLMFSYTPIREDYRDVIVLKEGYNSIDELPQGARIGTGSKRRMYQLLKYRPDLNIEPIRGNIDTRIKKIDTEDLHGVILAAAGINRIGFNGTIKNVIQPIDETIILPAPAQGILAIEIRKDREDIHEIVKSIGHVETQLQSNLERQFLNCINGSCHLPIGALCKINGEEVELEALYGAEDGSRIVRKGLKGNKETCEDLGRRLAEIIVEEMK